MRLPLRFSFVLLAAGAALLSLPGARSAASSQAATAAPAATASEEAALATARTVLFVRHAEKQKSPLPDPALSGAGEQRALALADTLSEAGVTHLFATEYVRTQATLAPLAERLDLNFEVVSARDGAAQLEALRELPPGAVAVVAGHSNTTPALVRALGGEAPPSLDESVYDRLFLVTLPTDGTQATSVTLRYGAFSDS